MGAASISPLSWRAPLKAAAILGTGAHFSLWSKNPPIRCDSARKFTATKDDATSHGRTNPVTSAGRPDQSRAESLEGNLSGDPQSSSAWETFTEKVGVAKDSYSAADWPELVKNYIAPAWTSLLPDALLQLQRELSMADGSVADEIWKESQDANLNPEITRRATVRIGHGITQEEQRFKENRRRAVVKNLASYLDLKEESIHPDDVPVIAMCSSGGGLRALVSGAGSYLAAKESGLWDCAMYTAGVSGSCWLQALYNSSLGGQDFQKLTGHLRGSLGVHFAFPPQALDTLTTPPTNKFLLRGLIEKLKGDPNADFGLVDIYGLLLSSRLLVSSQEVEVHDSDLKLSNQRLLVESGAHPLPIYTAVRHEIPDASSESKTSDELKEQAKRESWFQWFEFTPFEFFCEELSAGIPSWALGRQFKDGRCLTPPNGYAVPELRVPALMGLWASAFCATLAHYYKEIRPALTGLAGFGGIDSLIEGKSEDLSRVHPIDPATIPNYVLGLKDKLPESAPQSIFDNSHIALMDAGMSNNLPIYPLLRQGRDVDLIVAFDASADIKEENWLSRVDGYALQRGIHGWPIGSGWPKPSTTPKETAEVLENTSPNANEDSSLPEASPVKGEEGTQQGPGNANSSAYDADLTYCNIWLGTVEERTTTTEPPATKRLFHPPEHEDGSSDLHLTRSDAGIAVAYFPLLRNPAAPPLAGSESSSPPTSEDQGSTESKSVDPENDDYMSTWNFVYTPEQVDAVVGLAKTNFSEGEGQVKRVVRGIYERKKRARLERERYQISESNNPFC